MNLQMVIETIELCLFYGIWGVLILLILWKLYISTTKLVIYADVMDKDLVTLKQALQEDPNKRKKAIAIIPRGLAEASRSFEYTIVLLQGISAITLYMNLPYGSIYTREKIGEFETLTLLIPVTKKLPQEEIKRLFEKNFRISYQ